MATARKRKKSTAYSRLLKGRCGKNAGKLKVAYKKAAAKAGKKPAQIKATLSRLAKMGCNKK